MDLFAPRIKTTIATLRAQLPARIDAFNTEATGVTLDQIADDGAPLGTPRPGFGYVFGGLPSHAADAFPVVEVAIPDAVVQNFSIRQYEGDLETSLVVAVWVARLTEEDRDFPVVYEKVLGYARCLTEVLTQPEAVYPSEEVVRIRFAFAANPDRRDRDEMETFTFGGWLFVTTAGDALRP